MRVIPIMRYQDAPRAIDWLRDTFGFEQHLVVARGGWHDPPCAAQAR